MQFKKKNDRRKSDKKDKTNEEIEMENNDIEVNKKTVDRYYDSYLHLPKTFKRKIQPYVYNCSDFYASVRFA